MSKVSAFALGWWKQALGYGVVGGSALVLDSLAFFFLTATGVDVVAANVIARIVGAVFAFFINGFTTFRGTEGKRVDGARASRYLLAWLVLTAVSSITLHWVAMGVGLAWTWAAKPVLDGLLAVVAFLISRQWIYR
jgi:putative flippase GtrA